MVGAVPEVDVVRPEGEADRLAEVDSVAEAEAASVDAEEPEAVEEGLREGAAEAFKHAAWAFNGCTMRAWRSRSIRREVWSFHMPQSADLPPECISETFVEAMRWRYDSPIRNDILHSPVIAMDINTRCLTL